MTEMTKIVVADDDDDCRELVRRHLEKAGLEVILVADGEGAIDAIDQDDIGLVLMDIHMPGIGGLRAIEEIRARRGAGVALVVLSSSNERHHLIEAAKAGADDYLCKPISAPVLLTSVRFQMERLGFAS